MAPFRTIGSAFDFRCPVDVETEPWLLDHDGQPARRPAGQRFVLPPDVEEAHVPDLDAALWQLLARAAESRGQHVAMPSVDYAGWENVRFLVEQHRLVATVLAAAPELARAFQDVFAPYSAELRPRVVESAAIPARHFVVTSDPDYVGMLYTGDGVVRVVIPNPKVVATAAV